MALLKAVHSIGEEWAKIRDSNVVPGRTDMQLRDRYYNALSMSHSKEYWLILSYILYTVYIG